MGSRPALQFSTTIPKQSSDIVDHFARNLARFGLLGDGLSIDRLDKTRISFMGPRRFLAAAPEKGELVIEETESSEYRVTSSLWCAGLRRRCLLQSALVGAVMATVAALAFGWLIHISIPLGVGTAVGVDQILWGGWKKRLRGIILSFINNREQL